MAQTTTSVPTKSTGQTLSASEFNDVNDTLNANAADAEARLATNEADINTNETEINQVDARVETLEDDALVNPTVSVIDVTADPTTQTTMQLYEVTVAGKAHANFTGLAGKYIREGAKIYKDQLNKWFEVTTALRIVDGDADLVSDTPVSPLADGDMYIHRGVEGTIGDAGFLNVQGATVYEGDVVIFSDVDNKWALLRGENFTGGGGGLSAPTANETYTIGSGQDYEEIQDFLTAHADRPKNEYTITGTVQFGDSMDTKVEQISKDFTNVIVEFDTFGTDCTLSTLPFEFLNCKSTPTFNSGTLNTTSLGFGEDLFHYTGCEGAIGGADYDTTGGQPPEKVFHLQQCEMQMLAFFPSYSMDSDHLFYVDGGKLYLDVFTIIGDTRLVYCEAGGQVLSNRGGAFRFQGTYNTVPTKSPMIEMDGGASISNGEVSFTGNYNGTLLESDDSDLRNIRFSGDDVFFTGTVNDSNIKGLDLNVTDATFGSITATNSYVDVQVSNAFFDGGDMTAVRSTLRTNKADTMTYSEGSVCYTGTLVTADPGKNTATEDGIHFTP